MKANWNYREIKLDRKGPDQLYHQLADKLSLLIGSSHTPAGTLLPSALQLSGQLGINRATVRKAYDELATRHLIERKSPYRYQVCRKKKPAGLEPFPSIGVILPCGFSALLEGKDNVCATPCLKGIIDAAMELKLSTVMLELPDFDAPQSEIDRYAESLTRRLLGLIHIGGRSRYPDRPLECLLKTAELPQVYIGGITRMPNVGAVIEDNVPGAEALAEQFRDLNHREIGIVLLFNDWEDLGPNGHLSYSMRFRGEIIRKIFEEHGLVCPDRFHLFGCCDYQTTLEQLKGKAKRGDLPTAYWCHNDDVARWMIRALNELKIRVPEDISVAGYDGLSDLNDELTTIGLPFYSMGRRSVPQVLDYSQNGIGEQNRVSYSKTYLIPGKTLTYAPQSRK